MSTKQRWPRRGHRQCANKMCQGLLNQLQARRKGGSFLPHEADMFKIKFHEYYEYSDETLYARCLHCMAYPAEIDCKGAGLKKTAMHKFAKGILYDCPVWLKPLVAEHPSHTRNSKPPLMCRQLDVEHGKHMPRMLIRHSTQDVMEKIETHKLY